ncbi:MAG: hypothetical protein EA355_04705 [Rhodobacteraceae bacterium]|nr:MAG: hypothetical protein EA355_04705 [Paracoccaceae bacterium]
MAVVTLPMYDPPALHWATDALYGALRDALRARGIAAPPLTRATDHAAAWGRPDLLLSQTCGWPYVTALRGRVRLVATPVYAAEGCEGPYYRSAVVVRAEDPAGDLAACRGRRLAVNAFDSQSGFHALRAAVARLGAGALGPFFGGLVETGGHTASATAVAEGRADVAALDCVSWALLARTAPAIAARLKVAGWTPAAPGLPLITAADDVTLAALREAVRAVFAAPETAEARAALLIVGAEPLDDAAYDRVVALGAEADAAGCAALA